MASPQALSETDRRIVALWAADCADRVLPLFEAEAPDDDRARDGIARARAFGLGELDAAGEIRRRFVAGRAALASADAEAARQAEVRWQVDHMTPEVRAALQRLPPLGHDTAGPLGAGLLATGVLATTIRELQAAVAD